jgi:hypothetical protein
MRKDHSLLSQRGQMAFWAIGLWVFLASWSLSAFWQHIDTLNPTYQFAAKCGAAGGEFALLTLIVLHCFNKHIGVRKWALILGCVLAAVIVAHSGALRGLGEAEIKQADTEARMQEALTRMSKDQMANTRNRTKVAASAQELMAKEIANRAEKVKESSIFPRWYLNGWMYSLIFIVSVLSTGFVFSRMMNTEDVDADFNGIPDHLERDQESPFPRFLGKA